MLTFIHASDLHLDSPLLNLEQYEGAPKDAIRGATRRALSNLVELAVSYAVDFVLIAGDLYDGDWKDYNTGLYFVSRMNRLREAGIPVFLIAGNHDAASQMTRTLRLPENVHIFPTDRPDTKVLESLGVAVHGQGYATKAVKQNLARGFPERVPGMFNIGMLHTAATGREGHATYAPCSLDDLTAKGYDYWALGHVHDREILKDAPHIVFCGNLQGRNVRESGPKGCMVVRVNGQGEVSPEFHPLDVLRWETATVNLSAAENADAALSLVRNALEGIVQENDGVPVAVRIVMTGDTPVHGPLLARPGHWIEQIRSDAIGAGDGRLWIEKVKIATRPPAAALRPEGPLGEILNVLDEARENPEMLASFGLMLEALQRKLPRELREASDAMRFDSSISDDEWLLEMLEEVRPLLMERLR